jgi:hypothetical protein
MIGWFERHNGISWAITFIIAATMFYMSSREFYGVPGPPGLLAIVYHLAAYFFLTAFLMISVVRGKYKRFVLPSALAVLIFGVTDEIHQLFVPGRACSIFDVGIDTMGIFFAFAIYMIMIEYRNWNGKITRQK